MKTHYDDKIPGLWNGLIFTAVPIIIIIIIIIIINYNWVLTLWQWGPR